MKGFSLFLLFAFAAVIVSATAVSTKRLEPIPEDIPRIGQLLELVVEVFGKLYLHLFEGSTVDPVTFYDFTYDFAGVWSEGAANITNAVIIGTSLYERRLTINLERQEIGLHISFPNLLLTGNYTLDRTVGGCVPTVGCYYSDHTGTGGYRHSLTNVTFDAKYTLQNSSVLSSEGEPAIRYDPNNFSVSIDGVSLFAENYQINGETQTNWEERSEIWLERWVTSAEAVELNNLILGEATALAMNYSSRLFRKTVLLIFQELIGHGAEIIP